MYIPRRISLPPPRRGLGETGPAGCLQRLHYVATMNFPYVRRLAVFLLFLLTLFGAAGSLQRLHYVAIMNFPYVRRFAVYLLFLLTLLGTTIAPR